MDAGILHVDLDAFYAAVEERRDPSLRTRPMAVGRGVVLSANYPARRMGVRSGMSGTVARRLCPSLITIGANFDDYVAASRQVMEVLSRYTPLVEQISIDEAFLDVRGVRQILGPPRRVATDLRAAILDETGLVVSVGVARTKFLAKVASRAAKPDGLIVVDPDRELEFLHRLPVDYVWGVGPVAKARLGGYGIHTVGQLAAVPPGALATIFGKAAGRHLHDLAWNRDPRVVVTVRRAGSMGAQRALGARHRSPDELRRVLLDLADRVGTRMRKKGRTGRTIAVRSRLPDFRAMRSRARTLPVATSSTAVIHRVACQLLDELLSDPGIRAEAGSSPTLTLVGISVSGLSEIRPVQAELPFAEPVAVQLTRPASPAALTRLDLEVAVDAVRERFGRAAVGRVGLLRPGWDRAQSPAEAGLD